MTVATNTIPIDTQKLNQRIEFLDVKLSWLALSANVDRKTLYRWMNGKVKSIRRQNLKDLARALECDPEVLCESETTVISRGRSKEMAEHLRLIEELLEKKEYELAVSLTRFLVANDDDLINKALLLEKQSCGYLGVGDISLAKKSGQQALELARQCCYPLLEQRLIAHLRPIEIRLL